jgi:glycosyltransferase involved in cell wall biosynthesis
MNEETLLCLSHLHWDHVWQRPQHLMSRFTNYARVVYVDPPEVNDAADRPHLRDLGEDAGVRVLRPIFPTHMITAPDDGAYRRLWLDMLPQALAQVGERPRIWAFSPLADYLFAAVPNASLAVYDCMDDLASFRGGTDEIRRREANMLKLADLVFTGGHSMYVARKDRHPRVHCFPSGVDVAHYRQVEDPATQVHPALAAIPSPRLGYFGVLDERIDWPLIASVAEARPDWHWALVGPTAKVTPEELPVAPNIHYLGKQQYADLPAFLKGFDIATMPFALNEATRFISPTKTLEYLAGGKPVISSSVPDVAAFYDEIVTIADGPEAWLAAIPAILAETPAERQARQERAQPIIQEHSWDDIARRMWELMDSAAH